MIMQCGTKSPAFAGCIDPSAHIYHIYCGKGSLEHAYGIADELGEKDYVIKKRCQRMVAEGVLRPVRKNGDRKTYFTVAEPWA